MGENIEVKDVQKTEYLDKNGLDMLWAKVKENTHNQVEVERNRAVAKENSIVDTKADKSALDNYVTDAALKALEQKVTANTTAISAKQDKPDDGNMFLQVKHDSVSGYFKRKGELKFTNDDNDSFYTSISPSGIYCWNENSSINFLRIKSDGITLDGGEGTSGYAFTTNGETAYIPTKVSQLTNDSKFITAADVDLTPYATIEALTAVDQRVTANTTAIANINKSNGIPYDTNITNYYETNKPFYIKCDNDHTAYINPYSGIKVANSDTSYVDIIPSLLKLSDGDKTFEINQYIGGIQALDGTSDDSIGLKLNYNGLRIGKKSDINADNNELISISRQTEAGSSTFKVKGDRIENNIYLLDEKGLTNDKRFNTNTDTLYLRHAALHGAILVENNADLSIGPDKNIRTNPFWKFGFYGAEFNGSDSVKRIDIKATDFEYANIFGIKLKSYTNLATAYNNPCEIENNKDYVSFSKKIKVSDIITDTTTDSSLNSVLSKKVNTEAFNSFVSSVSGQLNSFNGALSTFGEQIASKQDRITPTTELDLTSIDTADIESLRSIVKSLATELNTLGLIKLKSAEETA